MCLIPLLDIKANLQREMYPYISLGGGPSVSRSISSRKAWYLHTAHCRGLRSRRLQQFRIVYQSFELNSTITGLIRRVEEKTAYISSTVASISYRIEPSLTIRSNTSQHQHDRQRVIVRYQSQSDGR